MTKLALLLILSVYLLAGCVTLNKSQSPISLYDFGMPHALPTKPIPQQPLQHRISLLIADATAPLWLDNNAIHYRLLYHNPTQSYTYTGSRWIAAPAALLTQQIRNRIVANTNEQVIKDNSTAKADYALHIELEEFTQLFDTTDASHIVIGFRASIVERNTRKLLAQKDLRTTEKTPTADAAGAVFALSSASNQLISELVNWLTAELLNVKP